MSENSSQPRKRQRPSFIWPMILIAVGVVFLLNNLGVVQGDFWTMIWQWWPVLFIAIGLDSLFRRNEIAGPVFLIGLGLVILMSNVGFMGWGTWNILWRLWPVLLVAIGLEIIIGRRSLWISILAVAIIVAALGGVLWTFGVNTTRGEILGSTVVNQALGEINAADIEINPAAGNLTIDRLVDSTALVAGEVSTRESSNVYTDFQVQGEKGYFKIDSKPFSNIPSIGSWNWDLGITDRIPVQLSVSMGAGDMDVDLSGLDLTGVELSQAVGEVTLIIPENGDYEVEVSQAIGSIRILLPQNVGFRISVDRALTNLDLPAGYQQQGDDYFSPGYETMEVKVNLQINQAIGNIEVED